MEGKAMEAVLISRCSLTHSLMFVSCHCVPPLCQNDGSSLACCINAATLALLEGGVAMKEMVAACSVAYMDNTVVLVRLLRHMT